MKPKNCGRMNDPEVTQDSLLDGKIVLQQPSRGYRTAIDSVLLAAAVESSNGEQITDFGVGAGAVSLCLAWREPMFRIVGYEKSPELADLARANISANGLGDRVSIEEADLLESRQIPEGEFDQVVSNPPFYDAETGTRSSDAGRNDALRLSDHDLELWIRTAAKALRHHGCLSMIFSAERVDVLFRSLGTRFGGLRLFPVWQRSGSPAKRFLLQARKGSGAESVILPGLTLHQADGAFTAAAEDVLRRGAAIKFRAS